LIFVIGGRRLTSSAIVNLLKNKKQEYEIIQKENKNDYYFFCR